MQAPPINGATPTQRDNLPNQPYFFGRTDELATITDAISPEARTWGALIDGPGGIGKTALAVRAGYMAPDDHFDRKIFLSAKVRDLTPAGEMPLEDYMLPNYMALLTELAREFKLTGYPSPAGGCLLTDPQFSSRLSDLFERRPDRILRIDDPLLLFVGRHIVLPDGAKVVVGIP